MIFQEDFFFFFSHFHQIYIQGMFKHDFFNDLSTKFIYEAYLSVIFSMISLSQQGCSKLLRYLTKFLNMCNHLIHIHQKLIGNNLKVFG